MHCIPDFAYSGRPRVVAPFLKPHNKTMPGRTKLYNDIHSCYRGRGEHLFGLTHPFGLMRHSWDGRDATGHAKEGLSRVTQHARRLSARVQHLYDIHQGSCDSPFLPNVMMHLFDFTDMQCLY